MSPRIRRPTAGLPGRLRERYAADARVRGAGRTLASRARDIDAWLERVPRHARTAGLLAVVLVVAVLGVIVVTADGGTIRVKDAAQARSTALGLEPHLRQVSCARADDAWECQGTKRRRPWTCRIFLTHTDRQAITGTCGRARGR